MNEDRLLIGPASKAFLEGTSYWEDPPRLSAEDTIKVRMLCQGNPSSDGPIKRAFEESTKNVITHPQGPGMASLAREAGSIHWVPDTAGFFTPKLWADHAVDALRYSITMDLTKPPTLTWWQRFRLWSPRRWLARAFRNIAEWLEPQGWE